MPASQITPPSMPDMLRGVSRTFYLSVRLLPARLHRPVALGYLLARACDTIADSTQAPAQVRKRALAQVAEMIDGRVPASAAADVTAAILPTLPAGAERELLAALPWCLAWLETLEDRKDRDEIRTVLRHIARGQALDIERFPDAGRIRALASSAQLEEYTFLVAGSVGEFWTRLCARHVPRFALLPVQDMRAMGIAYGMGLQLVNILRDMGADLAAGRCYLPADELARCGVTPATLAGSAGAARPVWDHWLGRAMQGLEDGMQYCESVLPRRVRAASGLPAMLGIRTACLLRDAGPGAAMRQRVKVKRSAVHGLLLRMAWARADPFWMRADFERAARACGWENPRP